MADTALVGLCAALGYRGSLQVANQLAAEQRAEIALSVTLGSVAAIAIFAAIITAVAIGALVSLEYALPPRSAHVQGPPAQR